MMPDGRRLAVSLMPLENRRDVILHVATTADRLGYDAFLLPEAWGHDTTVLLAEAALATRRIRLGTGILGVWSRSAGTLAMAASTLSAVSGGRFMLGLGASTPQLTEGLHDIPFTAPVARMRRVVGQVRALLRGERVPLEVARHARPLRLNLAAADVPIYLAALAPESVRLAGEVADGWLPYLFPRSSLGDGVRLLEEGAKRGARDSRRPDVCPSVPTVVTASEASAREGAAWFVAFYLTSMGTLYRQRIAALGFAREVESVLAANPDRSRGIVPADADVLLEELTVFGTAETARQRLDRWYAAGADMPVLLLPPNLAAADIDTALSAFRG